MAGAIAWAEEIDNSVCPSGADWLRASAATLLPAPKRFSTVTACFHCSDHFCASKRAAMSGTPPGVKPTKIFTGFCGNVVWAVAVPKPPVIAPKRKAPWQVKRNKFMVDPWVGSGAVIT